MPFAARNKRPAVRWDAPCPRCQAKPGSPCRNAQGELLAGPHIQRRGALRREIRAALAFYDGLGLQTRNQGDL